MLKTLLAQARTNLVPGSGEARRLFHGRGRTFPNLEFVTLDWYPPVAHLILHSDEGEDWLPELAGHLRALLGEGLGCVIAQRRYLPGAPSEILEGEVPEPAFAREANLSYRLGLAGAQNIGFFPDMKNGRRLVRSLAGGKKVLNLFAYTCSFSVAALAGGALQVVNLDMSRRALAVGRQNHLDNDLDPRRASFLPHDLFRSFGKLRQLGPYDLCIIDPPTDQGQSFTAERDWARVVRRLPALLHPGGEVLACLNSPRLGSSFLRALFAEHAPGMRFVESVPPPEEFRERDAEEGLKVLRFGS